MVVLADDEEEEEEEEGSGDDEVRWWRSEGPTVLWRLRALHLRSLCQLRSYAVRARAVRMAMPVEELPLVIVTLQKMVELMMDGQLRDPRAMAFVPTRRAVDYCNQAR